MIIIVWILVGIGMVSALITMAAEMGGDKQLAWKAIIISALATFLALGIILMK